MKIKHNAIVINKPNGFVPGLDKSLSELTVCFRERLEDCLETLMNAYASKQFDKFKYVSTDDLVGILRINYFLCESLTAVKRLWNTLPSEFQAYVGCPGEPPDGYRFVNANKTKWHDKTYSSNILRSVETGKDAHVMAQAYTTRELVKELDGWLALLFAYRSLLPYVTPSLDYLTNLASLDPLLALPNYETIQMIDGREIRDYKPNVQTMFVGRDEVFIYFDVVSSNANVAANGPIAGSISAPLFDSKDLRTGKRGDWAQVRYVLRKLDDKILGDAALIELPSISTSLGKNIYWNPEFASDRLRKVPIENIFMVSAPELLQRWFSYVVKMGNGDPRRVPCRTGNMTDVKQQDLVAITNAFKDKSTFNFRATPVTQNGMRHHINFANASLVAQNAPLVEAENTITYKSRQIALTPVSVKSSHRVWENSWANAFAVQVEMTDASQYLAKYPDRLLRSLDVANIRAMLGFGTGVFGAMLSSALIYGGANASDLLSNLESRGDEDQLARLLAVWIHALSRKGVRFLNNTLLFLRKYKEFITIHPSSHREVNPEDLAYVPHDVFEIDDVASKEHRSRVSGFSHLSTRTQYQSFFDFDEKKMSTDLSTAEGKRKHYSFLARLFQ